MFLPLRKPLTMPCIVAPWAVSGADSLVPLSQSSMSPCSAGSAVTSTRASPPETNCGWLDSTFNPTLLVCVFVLSLPPQAVMASAMLARQAAAALCRCQLFMSCLLLSVVHRNPKQQ